MELNDRPETKTRSYIHNPSRPEPVHELVWLLHGVFGMDTGEIVAITGLDPATVWSVVNDLTRGAADLHP